MLFKFLEKPIEITAFLPSRYSFIEKYSPIKTAAHFVPNFWKNIPKSGHKMGWEDDKFNRRPTVKSCVGIIKSFQTGFIVPMWCDLTIKVYEDSSWKYQFSDNMSILNSHENQQFPNFYNDYHFFKLHCPWLLKTSKKINFSICDPTFFVNEKKYFTPSGVVSTFNNTFIPNIFLFVKKNSDEIFINFKTPLLHIIPLTEKNIKINVEVISNEKYDTMKNYISKAITFDSAGLNMLKILRKQKNG